MAAKTLDTSESDVTVGDINNYYQSLLYYNLQVVDIRLESENVYQDDTECTNDVSVGDINNYYYDNYTKHTNKIIIIISFNV